VLIALACGIAFSIVMYLCGPWLYHLLGGRDEALDAALAYSNVLFLAAPLMWLVIILAAVLRGLGVVKLQAVITAVASLALLPLSPALIFGVGPIAGLGMRGAAIAIMCYYALVTAIYIICLTSKRSAIKLRWHGVALSRIDFASILHLGGISSLLAVQSHITALVITGLAGGFGTVVLAGFGAAIRLQHVIEPFIFSLGTATVVMVATCCGAGDVERARKAALSASVAAAIFCGSIGGLAALYPMLWMELFSQDPEVIAAGAVYLRTMGPFYWCFGLGLVLYYYSQGIGRMLWSYAGSLMRLAIVAVAGTVSLYVLHGDAASLYRVVAAAAVISCAVTAFGIARSEGGGLVGRAAKPQLLCRLFLLKEGS
jgi:Na+-driven multidrug efflux pump